MLASYWARRSPKTGHVVTFPMTTEVIQVTTEVIEVVCAEILVRGPLADALPAASEKLNCFRKEAFGQ
jgi:hypothetical protein